MSEAASHKPVETEPNTPYPPKFQPDDRSDTQSRIGYRSILSLVLYFGVGYLLLRQIELLVVIIAIIALHEMGHFLAMKHYDYSDVSFFFIPFFGAFVSGKKREISQKQSAAILFAGPLPGILIGMALLVVDNLTGGMHWGQLSLRFVALLFILLNSGNLLPVYPLDGGQLLNRVYLDEEGWLSNLFLLVSSAFVIWLAVRTRIYLLLLLPAWLLVRFYANRQYLILEKKITALGINLDISYEDLPDEDYWKIRKVLIENKASFLGVDGGPPYIYDEKEEKISAEVETMLQRNLVQDITILEKLVLAVCWIAALVVPLLLLKEYSLLPNILR